MKALIFFLTGTGLLLLVAAIIMAIHYCTLTVKTDEAVLMKKKGRLVFLRPGKSFQIPYLYPLWRCSLLPWTMEATLKGLENQDGALFTALVRARFSFGGNEESLTRAAAIFFGRTREGIENTLIELIHRNMAIFLPAYDRRALEHNLAHLLGYVEDSLKEDAARLGVTMESFSLLALYEEEHG